MLMAQVAFPARDMGQFVPDHPARTPLITDVFQFSDQMSEWCACAGGCLALFVTGVERPARALSFCNKKRYKGIYLCCVCELFDIKMHMMRSEMTPVRVDAESASSVPESQSVVNFMYDFALINTPGFSDATNDIETLRRAATDGVTYATFVRNAQRQAEPLVFQSEHTLDYAIKAVVYAIRKQ
jgi:hypothetical protein